MRPSEKDVTFSLYQLDCKKLQESADEPYMWILGFKVDADTIGPPPVGSLLPFLGVQTFEGIPASPYLLGAGSISNPGPIPIPSALGTRSCRLKPALMATGDWFPGLVGVVVFLWELDNFSPSTSEVGYKKFKQEFGPALAAELTSMLNGGYDTQLSQNAAGIVVSPPPDDNVLQWRLDRLGDVAARKNTVKAITSNVKGKISGDIEDALYHEAGYDELIDPDDLLGVEAQVYLGQDLTTVQDFSLDFTDNDASYTALGHVFSKPVHLAVVDSNVVLVNRHFDGMISLFLRVCWFPVRSYNAISFRLNTTTRFVLRQITSGLPSAIRWFLDDQPIPDGHGALNVTFESADSFFGAPQDALAFKYPGGVFPLTTYVSGPVMEISNAGGEGVYFGKVRALFSYPGDPSIFLPPAAPIDETMNSGYVRDADLTVLGVELTMDGIYATDVRACKRIIHEVDRKHIAVNFGKVHIDPGDPPPYRQALLDRARADSRIANAIGLERVVGPRMFS